jgi:hypothetical protein
MLAERLSMRMNKGSAFELAVTPAVLSALRFIPRVTRPGLAKSDRTAVPARQPTFEEQAIAAALRDIFGEKINGPGIDSFGGRPSTREVTTLASGTVEFLQADRFAHYVVRWAPSCTAALHRLYTLSTHGHRETPSSDGSPSTSSEGATLTSHRPTSSGTQLALPSASTGDRTTKIHAVRSLSALHVNAEKKARGVASRDTRQPLLQATPDKLAVHHRSMRPAKSPSTSKQSSAAMRDAFGARNLTPTHRGPEKPSYAASQDSSASSGLNAVSVNDFKLLRRLGSGQFADVFLAVHIPSGNPFAVKVWIAHL